MAAPAISVIISTYNAVDWLLKTLEGYRWQLFKDFEVIIADDGSTKETEMAIQDFKKDSPFSIQHIWHKDDGFQKTRILNKAILAAKGEYLLFSDGDCIPRNDFLKIHAEKKAPGFFLSGGYFKLPMGISEKISLQNIKDQDCFEIDWLLKNGLKSSFKNNKLTATGFKATLLNKLTPTNASWNGHNSSGWKKDILKVNGFDERMQYGGEDRELGERLFNLGIKSKQIRYSAICVHLDHERGYVNKAAMDKNTQIRQETKSRKIIATQYGIKP